MRLKNLLAGVALGLSVIALPALAGDARYEAALEEMFRLTYGRDLKSANIDEIVQGFRDGANGKTEAQNCPALKTAMDKFADDQFRRAVTTYFQSPALKNQIKDAMRKHYRQPDLDAFLAFAATPAGKAYLEHSAAAEAEVKTTLKASTDKMMEAPEFKAMFGEMMAELLPVMMKCQKG